MNRLVSINQVGSMWLRLHDANTDIDLGVFQTYNFEYDEEKNCYIAIFSLSAISYKLLISNYYKVQIAYADQAGQIGFYSTVAITKYTVQPTVEIDNLNKNVYNNSQSQYIGIYSSMDDPSEKNYQYMFEVFLEDDSLLTSTGWQYHNSNNDDLSYLSKDSYELIYDIHNYDSVKIKYTVKTNNGLICESDKYKIIGSNGILPSLLADLQAELDYDNGCINLFLMSESNFSHNGKFLLSRASSKTNYQIWMPIYRFELTGQLPEILFTDFTCAHGETYQYSIQQYNNNGIYSAKILSDKITVYFEDMYLYDGERQLKIRFNPKISSFKTVLQENKKNTLGARYPYFFRSGNINYKEFPISGLISYIMDENQYFLSRTDDLNMPIDWQDTFDIIDENIEYERKFKLKVLDWLNNGQLKLFKSPAEGSYIVRLMNTSLTSNDSLSRMISTFTTTATEAIEYNENNLIDYEFFDNTSHIINSDLFYYTIDLYDLTTKNSEAIYNNIDFLFGFNCSYLKIDGVNMTSPLIFSLAGITYAVGKNNTYERYFDTPQPQLKFQNLSEATVGTITIGIKVINQNAFNKVLSINSNKRIDDLGFIGTNWISKYTGLFETDYPSYKGQLNNLNELLSLPSYKLDSGDIYQINHQYYQYTNKWNKYTKYNSKDQISKIYLLKFTNNDLVYYFSNLSELENQYSISLTQNNNNYIVSNNSLPQGALFIIDSTYGTKKVYKHQDNELVLIPDYTFYDKEYNGSYSLADTQIYIDGQVYDLTEKDPLIFTNLNKIPTIIQWGYAVKATIIYELTSINYSIDNLSYYNLYNYSKCCRAAKELDLHYTKIKPTETFILQGNTYLKNLIYKWDGNSFINTNESQSEYWVSNNFNDNVSIVINGSSYNINALINNYEIYRDRYFNYLNNNIVSTIEDKIVEEGQNYGIRII